jgi:hypothetical protein
MMLQKNSGRTLGDTTDFSIQFSQERKFISAVQRVGRLCETFPVGVAVVS